MHSWQVLGRETGKKRKVTSQSVVLHRRAIKHVRKRWAGTKSPEARLTAGQGCAEQPERGWAGASRRCRSAVKPKAGLLSGSVTVAMTRPVRRGGIGHAGTRQRPSCQGDRSGRGRWGLEESPAPGEARLCMEGTPSVEGPVPLARGAALGPGGCRGCSWIREVLSTLIPRGFGLSASLVTLRVVQ